MELVSFLTGSVLLYFAIKLLLTKIFIDILGKFFTHPFTLGIIALTFLGLFLAPDFFQPYVDLFAKYFIDGVKSLFSLAWRIIEEMFASVLS